MNIFILGTGTSVGKTYIATAIGQHLGADYIIKKPIASGLVEADNDVEVLCRLQNKKPSEICLYGFQEPLSPDIAARMNDVEIDEKKLEDFIYQNPAKINIIEGVGGVAVPLSSSTLFLDVVETINYDKIILVAGTYLGTLNHTLLTMMQVMPSLLVLSESENGVDHIELMATLKNFTAIPIIFVPRNNPAPLIKYLEESDFWSIV
jgi:dethiobiotin synthase